MKAEYNVLLQYKAYMKEFLHDLRAQLDYIKCNDHCPHSCYTCTLNDIALTFT